MIGSGKAAKDEGSQNTCLYIIHLADKGHSNIWVQPRRAKIMLLRGFLFGMKTEIILIRHGETSWNRKKKYCGWNDIALNRTGINQAKGLRNRLKKKHIHKVYSSDMKRAVQTARIVFGEKCIKKSKSLREMNFGLFEGLSYRQIIKKYPLVYKKWLNNPYKSDIPKGEGLKTFKDRIQKAFKKIIASGKNKTVAVVSHGGAISIFVNTILKTSDFWAYIPKTATFSVIEFDNGRADLKLFNQ